MGVGAGVVAGVDCLLGVCCEGHQVHGKGLISIFQ